VGAGACNGWRPFQLTAKSGETRSRDTVFALRLVRDRFCLRCSCIFRLVLL